MAKPQYSTNGKSLPPVLEIENLAISYRTRAGDIPAVSDFSLSIAAGETVGLVGESGCGKSTVAFAIMRYLGAHGHIVGGSIRFDGEALAETDGSHAQPRRGPGISALGCCGMVYQEPMSALNPSLTIGDQLSEVPMIRERISKAEARSRAADMLIAVDLPSPERIMASYPHQISGGQQQRVVIAMALLAKPSLLLLDEPTTALDVTVEASIVELIARLGREFGTANLYISHNLGLIGATCERVAVMYSGQIVEEGRVADVFQNPRHPYTQGLFEAIPMPAFDKRSRTLKAITGQVPLPQNRPPGCNFGPRCSHFAAGRCDAHDIPMSTVTNGGEVPHGVRCVRWSEISASTDTRVSEAEFAAIGDDVLVIENLEKTYPVAKVPGGLRANDGISLRARQGETLAIVGESGCGKSTLAKIVLGLETATGGSVRFMDDDIGETAVEARKTEQLSSIQMVFQDPNGTLNPSRSVGRQIERAISKLRSGLDRGRIRERMLGLLADVGLSADVARRRPRQLSGGQKQRIAIARAFAGAPTMVVADEPVSALDVSVQASVTELLLNIQREHGTTLLFISHDLSVVRYLADRVAVMYLGRIVESGTADQVYAPPYHPYTEALLAAVPMVDPEMSKRRVVLEGPPPSPLKRPKGCNFAGRCPRQIGTICETDEPPQQKDGDHVIACHIPLDELRAVPPVFAAVRIVSPPAAGATESVTKSRLT